MSHPESIHWCEIDELSLNDLGEIGMDESELERVRELAEHPELENFYIAHAREPRGRSQ